MIKLAFTLHRLPELSREQFQTYWSETHAPLVAEHAKALGIKRYVQLHTSDTETNEALRASRGAPEPFDGIAELWFDSEEAFRSAMDSPEWRATIADVPNFAVREKSWGALVDEIPFV